MLRPRLSALPRTRGGGAVIVIPFLVLTLLLWMRTPPAPVNPLEHQGEEDSPLLQLVEQEVELLPSSAAAASASSSTSAPTSWCEKRLRLLPRTLRNVTLLASYPGSGNTWMRH